MYERLSEWFSNLSLLFVGLVVFPYVLERNKLILSVDTFAGLFGTFICLWISLRLSRLAERRK